MVDGSTARKDVADMTPERERWAEALAVDRQYGEQAPTHVAERIAALALENDEGGVKRWMQIAARLDQLKGTSLQ